MKPLFKALIVPGVVALLFAVGSQANAQTSGSCGTPTVSGQFLDAYFTGLPEDQLSGIVCVFGNPLINSGGSQFLCKATGDTASGGPCPGNSGILGDGKVMVYGDWFGQGVTGCPVTSGVTTDG